MNAKKILLAFDGSMQSLNAAQLCWDLASKHSITLTAQHVINTAGLWQLLNFELPGLTGSGPYIEAQQAMEKELRSIGETLVSVYQAKAKSHGCADQCILDEGDAISEVLRRSKMHDMVVIGHHPNTPASKNGAATEAGGRAPRYLTHYSMAETLACLLDKPLLVVQAPCSPWKSIKLILHGNRGIEASFRAAAELATFLDLALEVTNYFQGDETDHDLADLSKLIEETGKLYPDLQLKTRKAKLWPTAQDQHLAQVDCSVDSLIMIPTLLEGGERRSTFGTTPDHFVRFSGVPALLFWPADVESCAAKLDEPKSLTKTAGRV
jgi:hypothetical protein